MVLVRKNLNWDLQRKKKKRRSISHCLCKTRFKTSLKKGIKLKRKKKKENIQSAALFLSAAGKA